MNAKLPNLLNVALKEWSAVCQALQSGRQVILLRKGGIYEAAGEFEVENRHFLLFPTYVHQKTISLKPEAHANFVPHSAEPDKVTITLAAEVTDVIRLKSRPQMDALDDQHIWTPPLIDMRFAYRPDNPLYLLVLRALKLATPITIDNTPAYAGCKSWVPLEQSVQTAGVMPALDEAAFQARRELIRSRLDDASKPA